MKGKVLVFISSQASLSTVWNENLQHTSLALTKLWRLPKKKPWLQLIQTFFLNRLVTQNVDALHYKAQSLRVTELHGSAHRVVCLSCQNVSLRTDIQKQIEAQNPTWHASSVTMAPDGDVSLTAEQIKGFKVDNNCICRLLLLRGSYCNFLFCFLFKC